MIRLSLSYRVFFLVTYCLGLRLGETLALEVGDIDANKIQVHIRNSKGGKDRFARLTPFSLSVLRRFWRVHRHPHFIFPNRKKTMADVRLVTTPLDRGGFKKRFLCTAYVTAMPHTY